MTMSAWERTTTCLRRPETAEGKWLVQDGRVVQQLWLGKQVSSACELQPRREKLQWSACSAPAAARCSAPAVVQPVVARASPPPRPPSPPASLAAAGSAHSAAARHTARPAPSRVSVSPPPPVSSAAVVSSAPVLSLPQLASVVRPSAAPPPAVAVSPSVAEHGICARPPPLPVASAPAVQPAAAARPSMAADDRAGGRGEERTTYYPSAHRPPHPHSSSHHRIAVQRVGSSTSGGWGERCMRGEMAAVGGERWCGVGGRPRRAHRWVAARQTAGSTSRW